ncbi:MAG: hypothetical protein F4059_04315, partial [Gemmatimonadetes bacterium]|nr:hypothetical protein [Gemmatimonadota bacterium]
MADRTDAVRARNQHGDAPLQARVHKVRRAPRHVEAQDVGLDMLPHQIDPRNRNENICEAARLLVIVGEVVAVVLKRVQ